MSLTRERTRVVSTRTSSPGLGRVWDGQRATEAVRKLDTQRGADPPEGTKVCSIPRGAGFGEVTCFGRHRRSSRLARLASASGPAPGSRCGRSSGLHADARAAIAAPAQPQVVVASGDWPQFHTTRATPDTTLRRTSSPPPNAAALGVAWKGAINPSGAATYRIIESSPAIANGVVYIGSRNSGKLFAYAVNCATGGGTCSPLWTANTDNWWISSSPAVYNGVVYVGGAGPKRPSVCLRCGR